MRCRADQLTPSHIGWMVTREGQEPMELMGMVANRYIGNMYDLKGWLDLRPRGRRSENSRNFIQSVPWDEIVEVKPWDSTL